MELDDDIKKSRIVQLVRKELLHATISSAKIQYRHLMSSSLLEGGSEDEKKKAE
jgi:hypothetical protein